MIEFLKVKKSRYFFLIIVIVFFIFGVYIGLTQTKKIENLNRLIFQKNKVDESKVDLTPFWKVWNIIDEKYPSSNEIDNNKRIEGAIKGLMSSLDDPYSNFFDAEETKVFEEDIAGNFIGIGVEIGMKDKILTVISPLKGTPADKAGLKSGDKILQIDKTVTTDMLIEEAIKLIRGEKGTFVNLLIYREGDNKPREIKIERDVINIPVLETNLRDDKIFVIKLYTFGETSIKFFRKAMQEFSNSKTDKLILDLRGNPGGYLEASVDIASWFLPKGKTVVIEDYGDNKKQKIYRSTGYDIFNENLKFVILIDGGSASASEILAGALRDHNKAKLVGEQSYGKGSVQEVVDVTPQTILKVTVAKWLTPNNVSISKKGLTPDYIVEQSSEEKEKDLQLEKAVELLKNWTKIETKSLEDAPKIN